MEMFFSPVRTPTTPEYPPALSHFTNSSFSHNDRKRRSPSVDSLPALSAPSPASSYIWYPSSSPPASTPPDSPVRAVFGSHGEDSTSSSNNSKPVFIRRAEDDHGLHLLLLALESEPHTAFAPVVSVTDARQHDTSLSSPYLVTSHIEGTTCAPPPEYVNATRFHLNLAPSKPQLTTTLFRRPQNRGSVINDDTANSDPQDERSSSESGFSPPISPESSQEGITENPRDPEMGVDGPQGPMTSEEAIWLTPSQSHGPYEVSSNVVDSVGTGPAPEQVPETLSTAIATPPISPSPLSIADEAQESLEIAPTAETASISGAADTADRVIISAALSRHSSPSPLPDVIDPVPRPLIQESQPEVSTDAIPDVQEPLPRSPSPASRQSDSLAQEDQITIDIGMPDAPPSPIPTTSKIKKERKKPGHSIALPSDSRTRKRQRRTSEVENIGALCAESSRQGSSHSADTSTRRRHVTKRPRKSVSAGDEDIEASTSKPDSAPLKVVQQRERPAPSASGAPGTQSLSRSDVSGSDSDPCGNIDMPALLVDALVFGRLSSLSAPDLAKNLLRDHPYLLDRLGDQPAWVAIVRSVLETHSFFGRIPRRGLDPDGQKLEDTWYYEPTQGKFMFPQVVYSVDMSHLFLWFPPTRHLDPDRARAETLADFAPSRRRKAKMGDRTYFYAPVDMNRWVISAELGEDA